MTQQGTKSDNLRSSPRIDMVEGELAPQNCLLTATLMNKHAHAINKCYKVFLLKKEEERKRKGLGV